MKLDETRREEAAAWFAALRRGAITAEERQAFDAWRADPVNQAALHHMHELWGETAALKSLGNNIRRSEPKAARPRRRQRAMAAAVACLLVAGAGGLALWRGGDQRIETEVGEQRTATLPDGSVMAVNVATQVAYEITPERRAIALRDGEAAFFVRKDPERSFTVRAGDYEVRAVGTAFNVRWRDGRLNVAVSEGVVAITPLAGPRAGQEIGRLAAGRQIDLPPAKATAAVAAPPAIRLAAVDDIAAWRMRIVHYEDAAVADIVEDVNRFFEHPIAIADPALAGQRLTIRLQVSDRERTLATLGSLLGARVERGDGRDALVRDALVRG